MPTLHDELEQIRLETRLVNRTRMIRWAVRWSIGFGLIALAVHYRPAWSWLWWVGLGLAASTPLVVLVGHWVLQRKLSAVQAGADALKDALSEEEN